MASFNIPLPLDLRAILNRNSSVILNADQPAAPPGSQNVAWQTDEFGNLSASAPSGVSPDGITQPGPDGITLLDEGGGGISVEEPGNGTINIISGGTGGITVADNGGGGIGIQSVGGVYFQGANGVTSPSHSAFGSGATVNSAPTVPPDGGETSSSKVIMAIEETYTGVDLETGQYVGITLNPSSAPTNTGLGVLNTLTVANGPHTSGMAAFGVWNAAISETNAPNDAPAIAGGVTGVYIHGSAETPYAGGLTVDGMNFGSGTIDYLVTLQLYIGQSSTGIIGGCDGIAVGYNAGHGSQISQLNLIHLQTPSNGGDTVTQSIGIQIDEQTAAGVGTAYQIKSDGVSPSVFAGPVGVPYLQAQTVYSVAGTPLPAAATVGVARAFVSDASANVYGTAYSGSGGITAPVYSDGTSWYMG